MAVLYCSRLAGALLSPLAYLYRALAHWYKHRQLGDPVYAPVPVVVVGNISLGGSGKTPVVRALANFLREKGHSPGILSSGYGAAPGTMVRLVGKEDDPATVGDEALMLARDFPVAVGRERALSVQRLLEAGCDVLLSDDGLQHYRLVRDVEIVLVDYLRGFGNGYCLPAGLLREPVKRLATVDYIMLQGGQGVSAQLRKTVSAALRKAGVALPLHTWRLRARGFRNLASGVLHKLRPLPFAKKEVNVVAAIGNPAGFLKRLRADGFMPHARVFPDHYRFSVPDLKFANDLPVLMTEKDAVKCVALEGLDLSNYWSLEVDAALGAGFLRQLLARIESVLNVPLASQGS